MRTPGWEWASVSAVAMRKGPKNRNELTPAKILDHIESDIVFRGRRAELPEAVASWAVAPFAIKAGVFLDPFAGSGAIPIAGGNGQRFGRPSPSRQVREITILF